MNNVCQVALVAVAEDASTLSQFTNLTGEISKTLYLATHPEENDEHCIQL